MATITQHSEDWVIRETPRRRDRGPRDKGAAASGDLLENGSFLTDRSRVSDTFVAEPRPVTRGATRAPGALDFSVDLEPHELAVVAIRHASGALTFHAARETVRRTRGGKAQARFIVPVRPSGEGVTRGLVGKAIKAVVVKVVETAADRALGLVLPTLVRAFETSAWKKRGLREGWLRVTKPTLQTGQLEAAVPSSSLPSLLFVHGTFSNTASAFRPLADTDFFERVAPLYGDRLFAFDHFSLSRTPEENVRMLLQALPAGPMTFDVITHSRGGLVLRHLVEQTSLFGGLSKRARVRRAVLVAAPNEGTPLATPSRWEDTVGWIANLLEILPDNPFTIGAEFVANGLVWIARHASGDLPGLHAMDGDGDLITRLQRPPGPPPETSYSALVANYQPDERLLVRLVDAGVDQFFGSANDLVVPSEGGWRVDRSSSSVIPASRIGCFGPGGNIAGSGVTHVGFFSRPETTDFLVAALSGRPQRLRAVDPLRMLPDRRLVRAKVTLAQGEASRPRAGKREGVAVEPRPRAAPALEPLAVTVVNGDLTFEPRPLLVGHYESSKLTGAERVIDGRIGGTMQRALDLGNYPVEPGTHAVFVNTVQRLWRLPRPRAVVVVGLGREGKLQASELSFTVRQAVIGWAQRVAEAEPDTRSIELAATLIGSGGSGVSAGQAAQLIAQGVSEANDLLADSRDDTPGVDRAVRDWPLVSHLLLIELFLDRATEAWRGLQLLAEALPGHFAITDPLAMGTGPLPRPLESGYRGVDYDFITAQTRDEPNGESSVLYALATSRARTEVRAQTTQGRLVRNLVAAASSDEYLDEGIGRSLFKLLVPVEMEPYLAGRHALQIELDHGTAGIPWELLNDGDAGKGEASDAPPWAIRTKLLRKLRTETFRHHPTDADPEAHALVIGEPLTPDGWSRLPGALQEAKDVHACLAAPDALTTSRVVGVFADGDEPGPDARRVVTALLARPWRIVHIAGHGDLPSEDGKPGGVVLSDGLLGPNEIQAMRAVTELVFINCCHLAAFVNETVLHGDSRRASDRVRFAAGVAEQLINIGVRCVVAAGWAVDDEAASVFATTFYGELLKKRRFIEAVCEARTRAFEFRGNTWAAYQCYGDPDWQLMKDVEEPQPQRRRADPREFNQIVSMAGVQLALETLIVQTNQQGYDKEYQLQRLQHLEARWSACKWPASDQLAVSFAVAYAAANGFDEAIRWYETVLKRTDGYVPNKVIEQHANLLVRRAWATVARAQDELARADAGRLPSARRRSPARARTPGPERLDPRLRPSLDGARQVIVKCTTTIEALIKEQSTAERLSLCGSAMKRLAMVEAVAGNEPAERHAIDAMRRYYQRAIDAAETEQGAVFYPALNYIAAELALETATPGGPGIDATLLARSRESLRIKNERQPDFWSVVGELELRLYEAVYAGTLARSESDLGRDYLDLHARIGGGPEWNSVYDTASFVLLKYTARATETERDAARRVLAALRRLAGGDEIGARGADADVGARERARRRAPNAKAARGVERPQRRPRARKESAGRR